MREILVMALERGLITLNEFRKYLLESTSDEVNSDFIEEWKDDVFKEKSNWTEEKIHLEVFIRFKKNNKRKLRVG